MKALVVSHLYYITVSLSGVKLYLLFSLEKQLNLAIKSCFNQIKYNSCPELNIQYETFAFDYISSIKGVTFL